MTVVLGTQFSYVFQEPAVSMFAGFAVVEVCTTTEENNKETKDIACCDLWSAQPKMPYFLC